MRTFAYVLVLGTLTACTVTTTNPLVDDASPNKPADDAPSSAGASPSAADGGETTPAPQRHDEANVIDAGQPAPSDAGDGSPDHDAGQVPPAPEQNESCNAVAQVAEPATMVDRVASYDRAQLAGGVFADGTYALTAVTHYVEASHVDGTMTPYGRDTLAVHGGVIDDVFEYPGGDSVRFTATLAANGSRLQATTTCSWSQLPGTHFPEIGDWSALAYEDNSFAATPTSITIWTKRGNHESILRVFTKLP